MLQFLLMLAVALLAVFIFAACGEEKVTEHEPENLAQEIVRALEGTSDNIQQELKEVDATPIPTLTPTSVGVKEGQKAPDFELNGFQLVFSEDGVIYKELKGVRLSDFKGSAVFLSLWGSWCGYCRAEMPQMERLHQEYKERGLIILAVELGQRKGIDHVRAFVEEYELTFPILLSSDDLGRLYEIRSIPTTLLIGPDGVIERRIIGLVYDWDSIMARSIIESLLPPEK